MIITDSGDGSNSVQWVIDEAVMERIRELADDGAEQYQSGDGLQEQTVKFPDDFDIKAWLKLNYFNLQTMADLE